LDNSPNFLNELKLDQEMRDGPDPSIPRFSKKAQKMMRLPQDAYSLNEKQESKSAQLLREIEGNINSAFSNVQEISH
jgi:hypothetical protein